MDDPFRRGLIKAPREQGQELARLLLTLLGQQLGELLFEGLQFRAQRLVADIAHAVLAQLAQSSTFDGH